MIAAGALGKQHDAAVHDLIRAHLAEAADEAAGQGSGRSVQDHGWVLPGSCGWARARVPPAALLLGAGRRGRVGRVLIPLLAAAAGDPLQL